MRSLDLGRWRPVLLVLEGHGAGDYRVRQVRRGYEVDTRPVGTLPWEVTAVDFEQAIDAVLWCEADMRARVGGEL